MQHARRKVDTSPCSVWYAHSSCAHHYVRVTSGLCWYNVMHSLWCYIRVVGKYKQHANHPQRACSQQTVLLHLLANQTLTAAGLTLPDHYTKSVLTLYAVY